MRIRSSSTSSVVAAQNALAQGPRRAAAIEATIRRESKMRLGEGKKNLLALKTDMQAAAATVRRRGSGSTRMLRSDP
jgi:hypothetical protein